MSNALNKRPKAILMPGPRHLFWTTGVFYLFDLAQTFDVLIVTTDPRYIYDERFQNVRSLGSVIDIVSLDPTRSLGRHKRLKQSFSAIMESHRFHTAYLHNVDYVENAYMARTFRRSVPDGRIVHYQNGRETIHIAEDFSIRRSMDAASLPHIWPVGVRRAWVAIRDRLQSAIHYVALPLLHGERPIRPVMDVFTGHVDATNAKQWNGPRDALISYTEIERGIYASRGFTNVHLADHPAKSQLTAVLRFLGEPTSQNDAIVILPTAGHTSDLLQTMTSAEVCDLLDHGWSKAIGELTSENPGWQIIWKLHPAASNDPIFAEVTSRLQQAFPEMSVVSTDVPAELLMAKSRLVAGDTSTVLWWAALIGKPAISFDYFGYRGGDEMAGYAGIEYRKR